MVRIFLLTCLFACWTPLEAQDEKSPDSRQRVRAARDYGKQGSEAIGKIEPMLADPDLEVRIEAVKSIVNIGTQRSLDALITATRDNDPEIQIRATDGLVNFYSPGYVQTGLSASIRRAGNVIKSKFTENNELVIDPFIKVRPDVIQALGALVRGGSSIESRANAARAVGILRGSAAVPDILHGLRSKEDQVMYEGLIALQKIRDPEAAPEITFLLRDLNEKIQVAAIETSGLLQNKQALPQLKEAMERARTDKVRRAALTAIAMMPDDQSRPVFERYMKDRDDFVRAAAAEGIGRLANPSDLPELDKNFAAERRMPPRLALAFALVKNGKSEVSEFSPLQYLINTLNSTAWRGVSRAYLIELARQEPVRRVLEQALLKGTRQEKIGLSQILAVSGDKQSIPYLERLTTDRETSVAQEALIAVRSLRARMP